jgi:hypothetical protein
VRTEVLMAAISIIWDKMACKFYLGITDILDELLHPSSFPKDGSKVFPKH